MYINIKYTLYLVLPISFPYFPVATNNFRTMHVPPRLSFYWTALLWRIQFSLPQLPRLPPPNL